MRSTQLVLQLMVVAYAYLYAHVYLQESARVGLFFRPVRTCSLTRVFVVLTGGRMHKITAIANGGAIRLTCNGKLLPTIGDSAEV